jgi:hypothetical protein
MIISEKQIMQLIGIAQDFIIFMIQLEDEISSTRARDAHDIIEKINNQQNAELKEIT